MRVAIVHYHLNPGGVTRVIEAASRALGSAGINHVVLTGSDAGAKVAGQTALPVRMIPGLEYLTTPGDLTAETLTKLLRAAAAEALGGPPDLWHFHNHSLGKNRLLPDVVAELAAAGECLVLQIHDLAEAGRPENYPLIADCRSLYPLAPRVHYAFLNSRDLGIFTNAGLPAEHASLLPTPIPLPPLPLHSSPPNNSPNILFAPIRGIRRKNLGELVFLSALAPAGTWFAVSRAPLNPAALPVHDTWRKFASIRRLPIEFDVVDRFAPAAGAGTGFDAWVAHATHFVTTSIAEGFGLPFLEGIAHGKPLLGRNLPHLTAEHARHGIRTGRLYDRLLIPGEWITLTILRDHLTTDLERNYRCYGRPLGQDVIDATLEALTADEFLDFGKLPEPLQQGIIERLTEDPANRNIPLVQIDGTTQPAAAWLDTVIAERSPTASPAQLAPYSPRIYQDTLTTLYSRLVREPAAPVRALPASEILSSHLRPESFHFLLSALKSNSATGRTYRAVIFDIYGTLLIARSGGVKPDPDADPVLREILRTFHHDPPASPSTEIHAAVLRHHAAAGVAFPEVDLRALWRELLALGSNTDTSALVEALEAAWHPTRPMPGAEKFIRHLSRSGLSLGLLSNAQAHTLATLGSVSHLFAPELTVLSYQHGLAKPAPELFRMLTDRLAGRGIAPGETLFVGNDPLHDIVPAAAAGFPTALFTGHADSLRPGDSSPDFTFQSWDELIPHF